MPATALNAAAALLVSAAALSSHAAPTPPADAEAVILTAELRQLEAWYLACDRASQVAVLDFGTARGCSVAAEALLRRGFGGDFERLLAWWRTQRDPALATLAR